MSIFLAGLLLVVLGFAAYLQWQARRERSSFTAALRAFFSPPVFEDEEKNRLAGLLTRILRGVLVGILIIVPTVILLEPDRGPQQTAALGLAAGLITLGLFALTRRGRVRLVSGLLPSVFLIVVTLVLLTFGGLRSPTVGGYLIIVVIAGLLLGERGALAFSLLSLLALLGVYAVEASGLWAIPYEPLSGFNAWFVYGGLFVLTALMLGLAARSIREGLENARRLLAAERKRARQMELLAQISRHLTGHDDPQTLMNEAVRLVHASFGFEHVSILLVEGDYLVVQAREGQFAHATQPGARIRVGRGIVGRVAQTGQTYLANDTAADQRFTPLPGVNAAAEVALPLRLDKLVIGVLDVESTQVGAFDAADVGVLESLADLLAAGLQSSGLFAEAQRRLSEQTLLYECGQELLTTYDFRMAVDAIARRMVSYLGATAMCYYTFDEAAGAIRAEHEYWTPLATYRERASALGEAWPLSDYPRTALALRTRTPQILRRSDPALAPAERDALVQWNGQTVVVVPLFTPERVVGYFEIWDNRAEREYSPADIRLLVSLANQAAVAFENVRLHTAVQEHVRELRALLTANAALLSTLELEPLLENVLTAAIAAIPAAEKGAILLLDPSTQRLQIRAISGYGDPRVRTFAFAGDEGYSAKALREKRPLLIPDARADPEICYDGEIPEARGILSAIVAPLVPVGQEDQPIGVISLDATRRAAFTQADLGLLVAFANTAAAAIDNARLHAQVQALAATDGLTGLANRRTFDHALAAELGRAGRYPYPISLVILDIDSFKQYNDTYGHPAGDERLKAIASLLRTHVREPDLAARYGGEEFALLLPHTRKEGALVLAERLRAAAEGAAAPHPEGAPVSGYTLSLGVATYPDDGQTPQALLLAADNAELKAKRRGKNRVVTTSYPLASNQ